MVISKFQGQLTSVSGRLNAETAETQRRTQRGRGVSQKEIQCIGNRVFLCVPESPESFASLNEAGVRKKFLAKLAKFAKGRLRECWRFCVFCEK